MEIEKLIKTKKLKKIKSMRAFNKPDITKRAIGYTIECVRNRKFIALNKLFYIVHVSDSRHDILWLHLWSNDNFSNLKLICKLSTNRHQKIYAVFENKSEYMKWKLSN